MKELRTIIVTVLIIGLFTVLFTAWTGDMFQGYENVDNVSYIGTSQETMERINEMQESLQGTKTTTIGDVFVSIFLAPFKIGLMMFDSIDIIGNLANDTAEVLHVPVMVIYTIMGIITITVIFGILKIILKTPSGGY